MLQHKTMLYLKDYMAYILDIKHNSQSAHVRNKYNYAIFRNK